MNILYIGPYLQNDNWGNKSINLLSCLYKTGHNIIARPIIYRKDVIQPQRSQAEEDSLPESYDVIIQHCLPDNFCYTSGCKNILYVDFETFNLSNANCIESIKMADEVWVNNEITKQELLGYGIKCKAINQGINLLQVPKDIPTDAEKEFLSNICLDNFIFCASIDEESDQSIIEIRNAFKIAFKSIPKVKLIISGGTLDEINNKLIKDTYSPFNYNQENIILLGRDSQIRESILYQNIDCFITNSRSPSLLFNVLKSIAYHKPVICLDKHHIANSKFNKACFVSDSFLDICELSVEHRGTTDFGSVEELSIRTPLVNLVHVLSNVYNNQFEYQKVLKQAAYLSTEVLIDSCYKEIGESLND